MWIEIRDARGNVQETHLGVVEGAPVVMTPEAFQNAGHLARIKEGKFKPYVKFYNIFEFGKDEHGTLKLGVYDVATKGVFTVVLEGQEKHSSQ